MNVETINIAAVVFMNMQTNSTVKLKKPGETPYFYLNIIDAKVDDLCLVHNGDNFGLVKVVRIIEVKEVAAVNKTGKPLLAVINYDQELLETAADKLKEYKDRTVNERVQAQIDSELGRGNMRLDEAVKIVTDAAEAHRPALIYRTPQHPRQPKKDAVKYYSPDDE